MRSKYVNVAVLLGLLAVIAIAMRGGPRAGSGFQADLQDALHGVWGNVTCQVTVRDAQVSIEQAFPSGTRPQRRVWSYQVARFVALDHPEFRMEGLAVSDSESGAVPEGPVDNADFEAAHSEVLRRSVQSRLDSECGAGKALFLVDTISAATAHGRNRKRAFGKGRRVAIEARQEAAPIPARTVDRIEAVLVVRGIPSEKPRMICVGNLGYNDKLTVVTLK